MTIWNRGFAFYDEDLSLIKAPKSDLSGGKFNGVFLMGADLKESRIQGCTFTNVDLRETDLRGIKIGRKPQLKGHQDEVLSVNYSPDGKKIVSGSADNTLKIWDAEEGILLSTLLGHQKAVLSVCYSPDGRTVVSGSFD